MKMDFEAFSCCHCDWIPVLPLRLVSCMKCKACLSEKEWTSRKGKALFWRDLLTFLSELQTKPGCSSLSAQRWHRVRGPPSSCPSLWLWTLSASFSSSLESLRLWVSGTFSCCLGLCWSSSAWSSGYSGTWRTWLWPRRSSTCPNMTYCDSRKREAGLGPIWPRHRTRCRNHL